MDERGKLLFSALLVGSDIFIVVFTAIYFGLSIAAIVALCLLVGTGLSLRIIWKLPPTS